MLDHLKAKLEEAEKARTGFDIAEAWYVESQIAHSIQQTQKHWCEEYRKIPSDIYSPEFAAWLTEQYQLAMAKGVQLARDERTDLPAALRALIAVLEHIDACDKHAQPPFSPAIRNIITKELSK